MRVVAVIPARGGSKGLAGKNLRPVGGVPLVGRSAAAAAAASRVDAVFCSSDDGDILEAALRHGAQAIRRPADLSGDAASSESALLHALDVLASRGSEPEILVFLQCTSPFTTSGDIDALVAALDDKRFDCALLTAPSHAFLWSRREDGSAAGINHDETKPRRRRQELSPEFRETGAGYAMRVAAFRKAGTRFCGPVALVVSDAPPVEIDDADDLRLVEAIAASRSNTSPVADPSLASIKALVTDFDGVHTDDTVFVDENGVESVRCSRADGLGIEMVRAAGVEVLILSREINPVVARRAAKLKVEVIHGERDKVAALEAWRKARGIALAEIAYVGNDLNDIGCLDTAGKAFIPADAHPRLLSSGYNRLTKRGGQGAIREVCDLLTTARGISVLERPDRHDRMRLQAAAE